MQLMFQCRHRYVSGFELDAEFSLHDGVTALVGPSGSGKSTTLNLIAGLLRPTEGAIRLGDRVLVDVKSRMHLPPEERGIGLVFQDDLLFPHMTVRNNLLFGLSRRPIRRLDFEHLVHVLELGELLERFPATLSGGQRQRVSLGRAILRGPELLLLDEPLNAQHGELKQRIVGYLERTLREFRIPTLLVTHVVEDVQSIITHSIRMEAGRIASA